MSHESHVVKMALLKYLKPIDSIGDSSKLGIVLNSEISQVQEKGRKRGEYQKFSDIAKALIGRYASNNRVVKEVRHFKDKDLKQSTVRDWRNLYLKELRAKKKLTKASEEVLVKTLTFKRRGRPPLLGVKLEKYATTDNCNAIPRNTNRDKYHHCYCDTTKSSLEEGGATIKLNKEWARSVLIRIGYSKRRACSQSKILSEGLLQIQQQYLKDTVQLKDIPVDLILNWDQTAMKIVRAMDKKRSKRVKIVAIDDKRMITAVFANSLSGKFLSIQLVYKGTTQNCLPKMYFFQKIDT